MAFTRDAFDVAGHHDVGRSAGTKLMPNLDELDSVTAGPRTGNPIMT
jgi:hypothetical protein